MDGMDVLISIHVYFHDIHPASIFFYTGLVSTYLVLYWIIIFFYASRFFIRLTIVVVSLGICVPQVVCTYPFISSKQFLIYLLPRFKKIYSDDFMTFQSLDQIALRVWVDCVIIFDSIVCMTWPDWWGAWLAD